MQCLIAAGFGDPEPFPDSHRRSPKVQPDYCQCRFHGDTLPQTGIQEGKGTTNAKLDGLSDTHKNAENNALNPAVTEIGGDSTGQTCGISPALRVFPLAKQLAPV